VGGRDSGRVWVVFAVGCAVGVDLGMVSLDAHYLPYWLRCKSLEWF
jgi:hypothetical protein